MKKTIILPILFAASFNCLAAEWIEANLNQIELAGAGVTEGVYFAKDTPYQTSYTCPNSRYIVVKETKMADRTLSLALYAKSTSSKLRIYITGCDAQGYLNGVQSMLVSQ